MKLIIFNNFVIFITSQGRSQKLGFEAICFFRIQGLRGGKSKHCGNKVFGLKPFSCKEI